MEQKAVRQRRKKKHDLVRNPVLVLVPEISGVTGLGIVEEAVEVEVEVEVEAEAHDEAVEENEVGVEVKARTLLNCFFL